MSNIQQFNEELQQFNEELVKNNEDITITEYITKVNDLFYHIDIEFMEDFMELIDHDDFCIDHELLRKYGVTNLTAGSSDVLKILKSYEFIDGVDYVSHKVGIDDGRTEKNIYMLKPDTFKMILIRNKHLIKYAKYYLLLEKCVKNFNDFQILKLESKLHSICKDRVLELDNVDKKERFIIVFRNEALIHQYAIIRTQVKHVKDILRKIGYDASDIIVNIACCYANNLYNRIKEELKGYIIYEKKYLYIDENGDCLEWSWKPEGMSHKHNHVSISRNIGLINICEEDFIKKIHQIDEKRFEH